jgi:hypothetical protein
LHEFPELEILRKDHRVLALAEMESLKEIQLSKEKVLWDYARRDLPNCFNTILDFLK